MSLVYRLGLFDNEYAKSKGLKLFCPRRDEYPHYTTRWNIDLRQLMDEEPTTAAKKLADESLGKFLKILYEELIRKAFSLLSEYIDSFFWKYKHLELEFARVVSHISIEYFF